MNAWIIGIIIGVTIAASLAVLKFIFKKTGDKFFKWVNHQGRHIQLRCGRMPRQDMQRAIERTAIRFTEEACRQESHCDEEFRSDWLRWYEGDPDVLPDIWLRFNYRQRNKPPDYS